jgi:predicted 3-demethylubiquinone-9 3-methyltransferase (glyoxalase superfamily)
VQCGWLTDKYGISWQVVSAGFQRVIRAIMPMKKLDLATLQAAYEGK